MSNLDIHRLLQTVVEKGATDLHLTVGSAPALRIDGKLYRLKSAALEPNQTQEFAYSLMTERQKHSFETENEIDMSFKWREKSRFRANFFRQQGYVAVALRQIPQETPSLSELGLPAAIQDFINKPNGLVLVTGPTGSGKSTTLAAVIDEINRKHRGHILTIEDPIEYIHQHNKSIVNQREIGSDSKDFSSALKHALRQDPDFVLIGEIRDKTTMEIALRIAETGHLTLATMHTNTAIQTIHRVLDFFPAEQQEAVRTQLSFVLQGVLSQRLLKRSDTAGRALCLELLIPNHAIRHLIRDDKTHQIYTQMQVGQMKSGMLTMNQSLLRLVEERAISKDLAIQHSPDQDEMKKMLGITA